MRAIGLTNGGRGRLDGSGMAAIKKRDSARVMHAQRLAYVGSRGEKDMLALEDLPKAVRLIGNSATFLAPKAKP